MDAQHALHKSVRVGQLDVAAGQDLVEARPEARSEQIFVQIPAAGRVREISIGVAGNDGRDKGRNGDRSPQELVVEVDPEILKDAVIVAVVDGDRVRKEILAWSSIRRPSGKNNAQ